MFLYRTAGESVVPMGTVLLKRRQEDGQMRRRTLREMVEEETQNSLKAGIWIGRDVWRAKEIIKGR
jgi:hypothetical protein